jgi:hypothetical protein
MTSARRWEEGPTAAFPRPVEPTTRARTRAALRSLATPVVRRGSGWLARLVPVAQGALVTAAAVHVHVVAGLGVAALALAYVEWRIDHAHE